MNGAAHSLLVDDRRKDVELITHAFRERGLPDALHDCFDGRAALDSSQGALDVTCDNRADNSIDEPARFEAFPDAVGQIDSDSASADVRAHLEAA